MNDTIGVTEPGELNETTMPTSGVYEPGLGLSDENGNPHHVGMEEIIEMDTTMRKDFPEICTKLEESILNEHRLGGEGKINISTPMKRYIEGGSGGFLEAGICIFASRLVKEDGEKIAKEMESMGDTSTRLSTGLPTEKHHSELVLYKVPIIFRRENHGLTPDEIVNLEAVAKQSKYKYKEAD